MYLKNNILFLKNTMTFQQLAELTKIPKTTLFDITNGNVQNPRLDVLIKLKEAFKVSIDDLVFTDLSKKEI